MAHDIVFRPFDELPPELLTVIFSFVPCSLILGRLQRVCKTFYLRLVNDQKLWKTLCVQFWEDKKFNSKISLEKIFEEFQEFDPRSNWIWLARCFARENTNEGLSFRTFNTTNGRSLVSIGNMKNGKPHHSALELYLDGSTYYHGNFSDGKLHGKGTIVWEGGAKYQGDWIDGHREGFGIYQWCNGDRYEGEFKHDGKKEGKGIFVYADGDRFEGFYKNDEREGWGRMEWKSSNFVFEGLFTKNEPADVEASVHPALKDLLHKQLCTGIVTGKSLDFGQFFYECECADYCSSCVLSCARSDTFKAVKRWSDGTYCSCVDKSSCLRKMEPPSKKLKYAM